MSVGSIILLGLGPDANLLATLGYASGTPVPPVVVTTKTGAGGIEERGSYKPTRLDRIPRKRGADPKVEARVQETHEIAREIAAEAVQAKQTFDVADYFPAIEEMSAAQIDTEIARLLHKKLRNEREDVALLILLAMAI